MSKRDRWRARPSHLSITCLLDSGTGSLVHEGSWDKKKVAFGELGQVLMLERSVEICSMHHTSKSSAFVSYMIDACSIKHVYWLWLGDEHRAAKKNPMDASLRRVQQLLTHFSCRGCTGILLWTLLTCMKEEERKDELRLLPFHPPLRKNKKQIQPTPSSVTPMFDVDVSPLVPLLSKRSNKKALVGIDL